MNRYKRALENLGVKRADINEQISELQEMVNNLDTDAFNFYGLNDLQELVEKETPVILYRDDDLPSCPKCRVVKTPADSRGFANNYCNTCGKKLEWRKRDESQRF